MSRVLLALIILIPYISTPAIAQSSQGRLNYNSVELRIRLAYANLNAPAKDLRVELMDQFDAPLSQHEQRSDGNGEVIFRGVRPGVYRVAVKGENVEANRGASFEIMGFSSVHQEMIQVYAKRAELISRSPGPPVSIASLKVPQNAREESDKGMKALNQGNLNESRKHLERALQIYPEYAGAYNNLGVLNIKEGKQEEGRRAFEKALEVDPEFDRAYLNLARLYDGEKNYQETERLLSKYVTLNPANAEALLMLARAQAAQGKLDLAVSNCRKIHLLDHGGQAHAHLLAARILERNDLLAAVKEYKQFIAEAPSDPMAEAARRKLKELSK
jgi:tetratricopeptide (TPR) repeat protein